MADFNFILSIAGLNSAANINDNVNLTVTSSGDLPAIKVVKAEADAFKTLQTVDSFPLGLMVIQNLDENNSVRVRLLDTGNSKAIDKRLAAGGIMVLNSEFYQVSPIGAAFVSFDFFDEVQVQSLDGDAKVKIVYIQS